MQTNTFGNLVVQNLIIDDNGRHPSAECGSTIWIRDNCNVQNLTIRNVTQSGSDYRNLWSDSGTCCGIYIKRNGDNANTLAHWNYATDILVDDCSITAQVKAVAVVDDGAFSQTGPTTQFLIDDVTLKDSYFSCNGFRGSSAHIGQLASVGSVVAEGCTFAHSGDNLFEVDQPVSVTLLDCDFDYAASGFGYCRFGVTYGGATPTITMTGCRYLGGAEANYFTGTDGTVYTTCSGQLFGSYNPLAISGSWGDITIDGCTCTMGSYVNRRNGFVTLVSAAWKSVTINGCSFTETAAIALRRGAYG